MITLASRPAAPAALRNATLVVSVLTVVLVAGCSAVTPAGGGPAGGANGSGGLAESFGSPAASDQVKQGGTLVMALSAEPDQLDPTLSRSLYSRYVFDSMCQKLYDADAQPHIVPQLATALPTASADGKTVTIPVRDGAGFSDGTRSTRPQ